MIKVEQFNAVRKFHLARSFLGRGLYFTAAYWVDGMMVDTGCAYTVQELVTWRAKFHVGRTQWNSFLFHGEGKNPRPEDMVFQDEIKRGDHDKRSRFF